MDKSGDQERTGDKNRKNISQPQINMTGDPSIDLFSCLMENNSTIFEDSIQQCFLLVFSNRCNDALERINQEILENPDIAFLWNFKGCLYETIGFKSKTDRTKEALDAYDHAVYLEPDNIHAWYGKGSTLFHLGRYESAIVAFDKILQTYPHNVTVLFKKGLSLRHLGKKEEANAIFKTVIELT